MYEVLMYYMLLLLLMFFIISMFLSALRRKSLVAMKTQRAITVLQCESCDYKEEREFQRGDYVLKRIGACIKCGGPLYISMIYGISEKPS